LIPEIPPELHQAICGMTQQIWTGVSGFPIQADGQLQAASGPCHNPQAGNDDEKASGQAGHHLLRIEMGQCCSSLEGQQMHDSIEKRFYNYGHQGNLSFCLVGSRHGSAIMAGLQMS
jgi:hypothetical protein